MKYIIGIDEVGRAAKRRASRLARASAKRAPSRYIVGIDEVGRAARKRASFAQRYIVGIDEVGRGALAGPVVVAALLMPERARLKHPILGNIRDSKKLSPRQREAWSRHLAEHARFSFAIASVSVGVIERIGISHAANLAALRAYRKLTRRLHVLKRHRVLLDGGLYLGNGNARLPGKTVIRGDENIPAIAAASIVAKVWRDRFMGRLARRHPGYGLEVHKGYGTKTHRTAIRKHGASEIHRLTFMGKMF